MSATSAYDILESVPRRSSSGNPWTKSVPVSSSATPATSLADVMSEQLATALEKQNDSGVPGLENRECQPKDLTGPNQVVESNVPEEPNHVSEQNLPETGNEDDSDYLIAQMLQYELDLEHDDILRRKERHYNGPSKVSVSLSNYRYLHPMESQDELTDVVDFAEPRISVAKSPEFNARGYSGKGVNILTKHDPDICGRRNADRVMAFPPGLITGDDFHYDSKIPNKVYNQLKVHSMREEHRRHRVKDMKEDVATATLAVDPKTRLLLFKLVNGEILDGINGIISTGKESVVFHAAGGTSPALEVKPPAECALKVFKTTLNEFRNRDPYIREDYRFQERFSKLNPRKIVRFWAEKEMLNLKRMAECGIPCPEPVVLKKHILVMRFLGKDQKAAPKLKEAALTTQQKKQAYQETRQLMRRMYADCKLIHADFSEYNLLWFEDKVWVIDVSQSVEPAHPRAHEFLYRDCTNVYNFFTRLGLDDVLSAKELFQEITGIRLETAGPELAQELLRHQTKKEKPHKYISELEGASFDYLYDLAFRQRQNESAEKEKEGVDDEDEEWETVTDSDSDDE